MNFIDSMSGPGFLIFYFFTSVITLILFATVSRKKFVSLMLPGLILNGLGLYRLDVSLTHGHTNIGFLVLMMIGLNLFLFFRLLMGLFSSGRSGRSRGLASDTGDVATGAFFFGSWGGDSSSDNAGSGGSSDSGSSCSSGSSCGGGGCGGGGCSS